MRDYFLRKALTQSTSERIQDTEHAIRQALKGIRYGSVEIVIHDSKIVQIDRSEKIRLNPTPTNPARPV